MVLRERYEIIAEIGKGGMSTVYLARDLTLDSYWAVKQVKNNSSVQLTAFKKEVELLSSLNYADIPRIVDRIEIGDDYYVVMDFVDGSSLGKKVLAEGPQAEKDVVEWAKMICDTLQYLHTAYDNPIVYRDMKPDNVMLTQAGRPKLIDFGIAKECARGKRQTDAVGTRGYAAPEQYKGSSNILDERTDIYALGATLYYLVTGVAPSKPPHGVGLVRKINPMLTEGLDYIIAKCTQDNPDDRYQNCMELKADLEDIEHLTGGYRRIMSRKLASFIVCLTLAVVFAVVGAFGYQRVMADQEDLYQTAYQTAVSYEQQENYLNAAKYYAQAIESKPDDYDTHIYLLRSLLPHSDGEDVGTTKAAIDTMRKRYIDNPTAPLYQDPRLMYQVAKYSVQVDDPVYAAYAEDYIEKIKQSEWYKENTQRMRDIDNYGVVAAYLAHDSEVRDFGAFDAALKELEESTATQNLTPDEQLENYYTIIKMYSTYPAELPNAYMQVYIIGGKAKKIIDNNMDVETITFNNIVPLYQLVAGGSYNDGVMQAEATEKESSYNRSLEWFGYLEDLNVTLPESYAIKKANAYKRIFDLYNTPERIGEIDNTQKDLLAQAISLYQDILNKDGSSFTAQVSLAQACLDKELVEPEDQRNFAVAQTNYQKAVQLKDSNPNLSGIMLAQFSSLKQQMQNAGLEV